MAGGGAPGGDVAFAVGVVVVVDNFVAGLAPGVGDAALAGAVY